MAGPHFITLEGGEGAGKSTQAAMLGSAFAAIGISEIRTREPGGSKGAEAIRNLVVSGPVDAWDPVTESLLFMTARHDHFEQLIKPSLAKGAWVICDRFYDSTYVYQGLAKGVSTEWLDRLYAFMFGAFTPDLTLLLDVPVGEGLARAGSRGNNAESRFERMGEAYHSKIREGFLSLAKKNAQRIVLIDAAGSPEKVHASIIDVVNARFGLALKPATGA